MLKTFTFIQTFHTKLKSFLSKTNKFQPDFLSLLFEIDDLHFDLLTEFDVMTFHFGNMEKSVGTNPEVHESSEMRHVRHLTRQNAGNSQIINTL